ncbi:leucine-rich repeat extensin-like protein 6 [Benincasa hispida]|uniref:leucine-rich repeat extensin-like protein 6 n=1 Tax=Benincasa hispida TaxID=102211 RepID=UPI0019004BAD|nr:leucine-rich repeat extensin-like protein 6 [Benincasa hispida]
MKNFAILTPLVFFLLTNFPASKSFEVAVNGGIGVGVTIGGGVGGGGGGVWIGGNNGSPMPRLNRAYTALQAWKSAITSDPLGILTTWVGPNVCSYKGVFCAQVQDETTSSPVDIVAGIDLNHANLGGTLVKELSFLTEITLLHLNSNRFSGTVPESFREMSSLQELDLSNNLFSGPFPIPTLYIPNLMYLDLRFNDFFGPIPEDLFNKKLDAIFLNNNHFEGELPQNLGNTPASVINLANNKLNGNLPSGFGLLGSTLREILLLNNQLTGCIPEGIGLFSEMQVFDVSFNSLMGHLPDTLSCLNQIQIMNFGHNRLSGVLPDLICSLKSLVNLTVSFNFFSGLSQECSSRHVLGNLGFDFSGNCIPGRDLQRPRPECSVIPGGGLNCFRIPPIVKPLVCGTLAERTDSDLSSSPP